MPPPIRPARSAWQGTVSAELVANHPHHDPAAVVEEAVLNGLPAAEIKRLGVDREERLRLLEAVLGAVRNRLQNRPVARVAEKLLRLRRPEELQERLRLRMLEAALRERDRVLDQDRLLRQHVLGVHALLVGVDRLVLVGEQDVALALREHLRRLAAALPERPDVLEQLLQVLDRLLV